MLFDGTTSFPTPTQQLGPSLWIKRDDLTSAIYGGNKVRKLDRLFAAARAAGKKRIVTIGAAGSHQVVATAIFGQREGFEVDAILVAQPGSAHARTNLRVALAHGLRAFVAPAWAAAPVLAAARMGRDAYFVPLGGSNVVGSLGFVEAAKEVAFPDFDEIVVACGSGGTAAGLAVGGLVPVVAVAISSPVALVRALARRLVKQLAARTKTDREEALARLVIDGRFLGGGYGAPTEEGAAATRVAAEHGITLDATYTAKAFAAALERSKSRRVLYWHTLSSAPLPNVAVEPLPPALDRLFE